MTPLELLLIFKLGTLCGYWGNADDVTLSMEISCIQMRYRRIEDELATATCPCRNREKMNE